MTDPPLEDRSLAARLAGRLPGRETASGYLLRLSRPRFWLYLAGPALVGATYAADSLPDLLAALPVALVAFFLVPANVFLYGVNDVFDADVDATNPKKAEREVRYRGDRRVLLVVIACGVAGLAFLPLVPTKAALALLAWYGLAVEYSAPPLRFKTTPVLDSVSNGLYVLPGVVAYVAVAGAWPPLAAVLGGWLWTMGMHTFSAIPDVEPDRAAGVRTTATVLGERGSYAYCAAVWALAAAAFASVHPLFGALLALYPLLVTGVALADVAVDTAYWWFPIVNSVVGMLFTLGGLWLLVIGRGG
ncbi:MAG: prenyltransferase [Haloarculaceae archaeon]